MTDLFDADPTPRALNWNLWSRSPSKKQLVLHAGKVVVRKVRKGRWVAIVGPPLRGKQERSPVYAKMEDAMLWAEERLPMIELAGLA